MQKGRRRISPLCVRMPVSSVFVFFFPPECFIIVTGFFLFFFQKRESGVLKLRSPERDQGPGPTAFHVAAWLQIVRELTAPTTSLFTL